jgi:hyperosmotically inducible protein
MVLAASAASLVATAANAQSNDKIDRAQQDKFRTQAEATQDRERIAGYVGDATLTAKVKTALVRAPDLSAMDVNVETSNGRVLLSGFVESDEQRKKALQVASSVDGVKEVKDGMTIK